MQGHCGAMVGLFKIALNYVDIFLSKASLSSCLSFQNASGGEDLDGGALGKNVQVCLC